MIVSSVVSYVATVIVFVYAGVTLSYGEEDDELFHPNHITEVVQSSLHHTNSTLSFLYTNNGLDFCNFTLSVCVCVCMSVVSPHVCVCPRVCASVSPHVCVCAFASVSVHVCFCVCASASASVCPEQKFVLSRMVKAANSTMVLSGVCSLVFSSLITYVGCRSLPICGCYDSVTGMVSAHTQFI